jgi:hypothetical protein
MLCIQTVIITCEWWSDEEQNEFKNATGINVSVHGDHCTAGCKTNVNFAPESVTLMSPSNNPRMKNRKD